MRWGSLRWLAVVIALAMLEENWVKAAPGPRSEDMFRELLKLDQMYSAMARPSVRSGPVEAERGQKVQRAITLRTLQELDRIYSDRARPRFGKRTDTNSNFAPIDYEGQHNDSKLKSQKVQERFLYNEPKEQKTVPDLKTIQLWDDMKNKLRKLQLENKLQQALLEKWQSSQYSGENF